MLEAVRSTSPRWDLFLLDLIDPIDIDHCSTRSIQPFLKFGIFSTDSTLFFKIHPIQKKREKKNKINQSKQFGILECGPG
jgi:hypothetical protein